MSLPSSAKRLSGKNNVMATSSLSSDLKDRFAGLLLGMAVGDALGLPAEGISRDRIQRMWRRQWRHRFLFGRGMISDDTEHTLFVAQSLLTHPDDVTKFQRCLAWKLRLWLLGENRPYVSCTWLHTYAWSCNRVVSSIQFTRSNQHQ